MLLQGVTNPDEINYYFKKTYHNKNRALRETRIRNMRDMEELQKSHMELRARIQELHIEVNCMNDSHVPSQPALLPPYRDPGKLPGRDSQPPDVWNSQGFSGNVFVNPRTSSSSPYPGGFNPRSSNVTEDTPVLSSTGRGERQKPDTALDPRFQPGPSAGNSFDPDEGRFSNNYGPDQQRLQISNLRVP